MSNYQVKNLDDLHNLDNIDNLQNIEKLENFTYHHSNNNYQNFQSSHSLQNFQNIPKFDVWSKNFLLFLEVGLSFLPKELEFELKTKELESCEIYINHNLKVFAESDEMRKKFRLLEKIFNFKTMPIVAAIRVQPHWQ